MNRHLVTEGIVLRKTDLNEADRIVSLLTPEHGKVECIAKGARRIKSKFCGRLELFSRLRVVGFQGRDLVTLDEAHLLDPFPHEKSPGQHRILFAMAEVTQKLIQPRQHLEGAYPLLCETLEILKSTAKHDSLFYAYLVRLLTLAGFLPRWNQCALCGEAFHAHKPLFIRTGDAHAVCETCKGPLDRPFSAPLPQWIHHLQRSTVQESLRVVAEPHQGQALWAWLREVLEGILPHPLRSEGFLRG